MVQTTFNTPSSAVFLPVHPTVNTTARIRFHMVGNSGAENLELPFEAKIPPVFGSKDTANSWDLSNQHNGSIIIVNKQKDGTTVMTNASTYTEVSVTVKDFTPSKNADGSLKQGDFAMQIAFVFSDGKQYEVRIHNTDADGNYKIQTVGGDNHLTGWKWRADLTEEQKKSLLEGDGVKFTVKLEGSDAVMYIDGTKMATVALGDDYNGKTAQVKLCMNGNKNGQNIEIPTTTPATNPVTPPSSSGNTYILNTNSMKFHYPHCSSADDIATHNRQEYTGNRDYLISQGYSPCKRCNP